MPTCLALVLGFIVLAAAISLLFTYWPVVLSGALLLAAFGLWEKRRRAAALARDLQLLEDDPANSPISLGAFLDVETTGLKRHEDEVIELAVLLFAYERATGKIKGVVDHYVGLREPSRPISPGASEVNGITARMLKGKRLNDARVMHILNKAQVLVAHNARFDSAFLARLYPDSKNKLWLCSMKGINWSSHGCHSRSLQSILEQHGIKPSQSHRAEADCRAALELLGRTCKTTGQPYFAELLKSDPVPIPGSLSEFPSRACPYCGVIFDSPPQRRRKCPECGEVIVVRSSDGRKLLLTEDGAREYDLQLQEENQLRLVEESEEHYQQCRRMHRETLLRYKANFDVILGVAIHSVGGCPVCQAMDGNEYTIDQALKEMPLPVKGCTYRRDIGTGEQRGWCRCTWIPITKSWENILGPKGKGIPDTRLPRKKPTLR